MTTIDVRLHERIMALEQRVTMLENRNPALLDLGKYVAVMSSKPESHRGASAASPEASESLDDGETWRRSCRHCAFELLTMQEQRFGACRDCQNEIHQAWRQDRED